MRSRLGSRTRRCGAIRSGLRDALIHTAAGDADAAFEALGRAVDEHYWRVLDLRVDPRLDPLRDDPRFAPLVQRLGIAD